MIIKDWKVKQIAREQNGGFLEEINGVVRETEKAYLLNVTWAYTSSLCKKINVWVPKSCVIC